MLDHTGFPVSDYTRSKAFYEKTLAPLGYALIMEVAQSENDSPAAGFGANGKPDFWIGGEAGLNRTIHIAFAAKDRATVDAFYRAAIAAGGKDKSGSGLRPHITRTITAPSCSIRMGTISKRSVIRPRSGCAVRQF
jgi:catechol 2,3-dioxygenase-like lactoylglutathione lyase family enzyme